MPRLCSAASACVCSAGLRGLPDGDRRVLCLVRTSSSSLSRPPCPIAGARLPRSLARRPRCRFMTLDPGHFHASLVQKEMYPGVAPRVDVYAPLGSDLTRAPGAHRRVQHARREADRVAARDPYRPRLLRAACSARSPATSSSSPAATAARSIADRRSVEAGLNVLADKPWILQSADLPALDSGARRRRPERRRRLRHHDRAVRGDDRSCSASW